MSEGDAWREGGRAADKWVEEWDGVGEVDR